MKKESLKNKRVIGRCDKVDFPLLGISDIDVKVDTGAYTSSIHCRNIEEKDGVLHAILLDEAHEQFDGKPLEFTEYIIKKVRSSNGIKEERYAVKANIILFGKAYKISLTLSNRRKMRFPVLIGRKFLAGKFLVDPDLKYLSYLEKTDEN